MVVATLVGAVKLLLLTGCSSNDKMSTMPKTVGPTVIPTTVSSGPVSVLRTFDGSIEGHMPTEIDYRQFEVNKRLFNILLSVFYEQRRKL